VTRPFLRHVARVLAMIFSPLLTAPAAAEPAFAPVLEAAAGMTGRSGAPGQGIESAWPQRRPGR